MKTHLLAMTSTTLLCDFLRHLHPGSRTCFSCTALRCRFDRTLLLPKELLQGFGKVLLKVKAIYSLFGLGSAKSGSFAEDFATIA
jgi:hypothetical protein